MALRVLVGLALAGCVADAGRLAASMESGVWAPRDVDMVSHALDTIMKQPHLTKDQLASVQKVAALVKQNLAIVESQKLRGDARKQKVGEAITALTNLELEWQKNAAQAKAKHDAMEKAEDEHIKELQRELAEKQGLMAKDEDEIKVLNLEKELAEKKLKLDTLLMKKDEAASKKALEEERKARTDLFEKIGAVVQSNSSSTKKEALDMLHDRVTRLNEAVTKIDEAEKEGMHKIDAMKNDKDAKLTKMLLRLKKEEHRKFAKSKAIKAQELGDLNKAIQSIEKGDKHATQETLNKMKRDAKRLDATSGNFLH
jgi:hypothetical protein